MQGFLLGLANGATCLAYCAPVLVPLFLGEGKKTSENWGLMAKFLIGRLGGYMLFGLLAWITGRLILTHLTYRSLVFGVVYITLAGLMLFYGLSGSMAPGKQSTEGGNQPPVGRLRMATGRLFSICLIPLRDARRWLARWPAVLPFGLGFFTGLNLCPPFLAAFTEAASAQTWLGSMVLFAAFFLGTSVYMIPIPFLGVFSQNAALRTIGKWAAVLMAFYDLYSGAILFAGGVSQL
jgi:sulfite exporter TauE/SafE